MNRRFNKDLIRLISIKGSWEYSFDEIKDNGFIRIFTLDDGKIRLFSWKEGYYDCGDVSHTYAQYLDQNSRLKVQKIYTTIYDYELYAPEDNPIYYSTRIFDAYDIVDSIEKKYLLLSVDHYCNLFKRVYAQMYYFDHDSLRSCNNIYNNVEVIKITARPHASVNLKFDTNELVLSWNVTDVESSKYNKVIK